MLKELKRSRERLAKLINSIADRNHNNIVEHIVGQIKNWTNTERQYSWYDVALSMLKFPESVLLGYDMCPDCGEKRIKIFFYSPEWTWTMMCGIGGNMIICPNCKIQAEFKEKIRN